MLNTRNRSEIDGLQIYQDQQSDTIIHVLPSAGRFGTDRHGKPLIKLLKYRLPMWSNPTATTARGGGLCLFAIELFVPAEKLSTVTRRLNNQALQPDIAEENPSVVQPLPLTINAGKATLRTPWLSSPVESVTVQDNIAFFVVELTPIQVGQLESDWFEASTLSVTATSLTTLGQTSSLLASVTFDAKQYFAESPLITYSETQSGWSNLAEPSLEMRVKDLEVSQITIESDQMSGEEISILIEALHQQASQFLLASVRDRIRIVEDVQRWANKSIFMAFERPFEESERERMVATIESSLRSTLERMLSFRQSVSPGEHENDLVEFDVSLEELSLFSIASTSAEDLVSAIYLDACLKKTVLTAMVLEEFDALDIEKITIEIDCQGKIYQHSFFSNREEWEIQDWPDWGSLGYRSKLEVLFRPESSWQGQSNHILFPWEEWTERFFLVSLNSLFMFFEVTILSYLLKHSDIEKAEVTLTYQDEAQDVAISNTFTVKPSGEAQIWRLRLLNPSHRTYQYQVNYFSSEGSPHEIKGTEHLGGFLMVPNPFSK
ncbi:hypothetical protein VB780_24610 [Leptolyngbya sp. CCNP1308]|uniref:hypothetical protein n=1 Tax=Leptolyngbya sp. CCNP1308 TaxID=3110255 RepID=UPI002B1F743B|nr:hypothetical protein [Leptolyngbya sp. CCNP1308]MEA5451782.1 hypothetical protein [Leptolyngbya sp. CCNP1308]